jgi:hypothetical protein
MILFFISHTSCDNEEVGAFVSARSRAEAIKLWQTWAHDLDMILEPGEPPKWVFIVPRLAEHPRVHAWHSDNDVINADMSCELEIIARAVGNGITSYPASNPEGVE